MTIVGQLVIVNPQLREYQNIRRYVLLLLRISSNGQALCLLFCLIICSDPNSNSHGCWTLLVEQVSVIDCCYVCA